MKALLTFGIFFFGSLGGIAQTKVSGTVTGGKGLPLAWANVSLQGTYDGATTGEDGHFEFTTSGNGTKTISSSYTGFKTYTADIELKGVPVLLNIHLQDDVHALDAVTITAGSFTAGDQSRRTIFRAVDIATTAGATADIAGALNTLPGTQKVGESGRLFVRGGDGHETRTFIDGLVVMDPYNPSAPNAPARGRFLPFMFKGTSFSTGGYSAEYGQALSSALVLDSKDKAEVTRTDFGILSVGADAGHTEVWDKGSAGGKIQYTNVRPYFGLIDQEIDWIAPPASFEGHTAWRQQTGKHGLLKLYGNINHTEFSLFNHRIDDYSQKELYDLTNDYAYLNGFYKNALNENWVVRGGVSYTSMQDHVSTGNTRIDEKERAVHAKTVFEGSLSDRIELKTGVEVIGRDHHYSTNEGDRSLNELIAAAFAEADVFTSKTFVSRGGIRLEYNALTNRVQLDPRFSLGYKMTSTTQLAMAYGKFSQSARNDLLLVNPKLRPEEADHLILNCQMIDNNRTFRIEGYHKRYTNLVKYNNGDKNDLHNSGYGFASGLELFWRDRSSFKNVDYWISYSFLDTKRDYLHFPLEATPHFASKHNFSAVYKHFINPLKSQVGITYGYTSGRPFDNPNSNSFNSGRTPSYQDLSLNWSFLPNPSLIIYFSCTNLLRRDNIFGYEYSHEKNEEGLFSARALRQPAKSFLFIGVFITLSKDKSVNQLPNL